MHYKKRITRLVFGASFLVAAAVISCVNNPPVMDDTDATPEKALLLDASNFDAQIVQSGGVAVVEFYQKGCGTCALMSWVIDSLTTLYADSAVIGAVDIEGNMALVNRFSVRVVPSYLFFSDGVPFLRRSADQLDSNAVDTLAALLKKVLDCSATIDTPIIDTSTVDSSHSRALMLTSANFDSAIAGDYSLAIIDFFSPYCSHCIYLAPTIDTLANTLPDDILIGKVNIINEILIRELFDIYNYPTIVYFKNGLEIHRTIGANSAEFFMGVIDSLLKTP